MDIDEGMVQGWTGRYDCILHSHILLYVTAKLRKKGILSAGEGYKGKVMIDETLFCFFFSRKSTKIEKKLKCSLIEEALTEAYAELGLDDESLHFFRPDDSYLSGAGARHHGVHSR